MWKVSDYTVMVDANGNIQCIQGPNGMSIPAELGNSRYQDFMAVDTDAHLCKRVVQPTPVPDPTPSDKDRIAALESAVLVLTGV